jgi:DNA polymerase
MITLDVLKEEVSNCTKCSELSSTRKNTVFGIGPVPAKLMFIGEAPGADEDEKGEPFVGAAGKLLDNIINACGWKRSEIYIANILKCRPPKNRRPTDTESANCRSYLDTQIDTVNPEWIVCWGSTSGMNLFNQGKTGIIIPSLSNARGKVFAYKNSKVVCTYHPAYLLPHRRPDKKKDVWEDLQVVIKSLRQDNHENN